MEVVNTASNAEVEGVEVVDNEDGTYLISYTPEVSGKYSVDVSFKDKSVRGGPFTCVFKDDLPEEVNRWVNPCSLHRLQRG